MMALWLMRAGSAGEHEKKFLDENRIYLTWEGLDEDLSKIVEKIDLYKLLLDKYPENKQGAIRNYTGQVWPFVKEMQIGDWFVLPSKMKPAIHVGEIKSDYINYPQGNDPYYHYRKIKWLANDIPRSNFDQDLLYSFGAFMTICRISRNDAENRIHKMSVAGWKTTKKAFPPEIDDITAEEAVEDIDLEQLARDQIAKFIIRKYKGHGMARLVEAILNAQGYTTYRSPEGPDKGIDILASTGPLGFGSPKICVQVKTGDSPVDRPTLDQLIGTMQNVQAERGLLVSWGGFKNTVDKEIPSQFFKVRLWNQDTLIQELMTNYEKLDEDIKAELPLKRIWTLTLPEED
jgi:restriction system protein